MRATSTRPASPVALTLPPPSRQATVAPVRSPVMSNSTAEIG
jgi:hypothetical protein